MTVRTARLLLALGAFVAGLVLFSAVLFIVTGRSPAPIERAISSAGGVARDAIDEGFMLRQRPGAFVAGEMLDWEAPTGGYLLQASFATGAAAARGALARLVRDRDAPVKIG